jgi:hypothetical protein
LFWFRATFAGNDCFKGGGRVSHVLGGSWERVKRQRRFARLIRAGCDRAERDDVTAVGAHNRQVPAGLDAQIKEWIDS